jgi:hypothetical protein
VHELPANILSHTRRYGDVLQQSMFQMECFRNIVSEMCLRFTLANTEEESACPWIHIANVRLINNSVSYHFPHPLPLALVFPPLRLSGGAQPKRVVGEEQSASLQSQVAIRCPREARSQRPLGTHYRCGCRLEPPPTQPAAKRWRSSTDHM